jgi:hypothetical protein
MNYSPLIGLLALCAIVTGCATSPKKEKPLTQIDERVTHASLSEAIQTWPEASKIAANSMLTKYGLPKEMNEDHLIWENTAPFKRSIVYREELNHNFPTPHTDVLEQIIDYKIPAEKVADLWNFNGSLIMDRTKGELSARCEKEEMNLLALNLAHELIKGEMTVKAAKEEFARSSFAFSMGNTNQYTTALTFTPASETADAGMAIDARKPARSEKEAMEADEPPQMMESENLELE